MIPSSDQSVTESSTFSFANEKKDLLQTILHLNFVMTKILQLGVFFKKK